MKRKVTVPRFAICIDNSEYPASLELHKIYWVLPDDEAASEGDLRVIGESGEDYLFPADYFILLELPRKIDLTLRASFSRSPQSVAG